MAYVATRGGEAAIQQAEKLFRAEIGDLTPQRVAEIERALPWLIDRLMGEASLYARDIAALALAQTGGELYESVLLLRAWRSTQPRLCVAETVALADTITHRRISAAFRDLDGGQVLGPTLDYSHRLLRAEVLRGETFRPEPVDPAAAPHPARLPALTDWQAAAGLLDRAQAEATPAGDIPDLTRAPLLLPAPRAMRLQALARADTGATLGLGYSAQRGYASAHPTVNELRLAEADIMVRHPSGTAFSAGRVRLSSCEMVAKTAAPSGKGETLSMGFTATLGWNEVKVIAGSTLDLNMNLAPNPEARGPAGDEEFVLYHTEPLEASGFCIHLKLPHYVTFQSALDALRGITRDGPVPRSPDDVAAEADARLAAEAAGEPGDTPA
ncbi:MAG: carbon-phosphorus lyase complex subunit PhnI [Rhodovulum sp.]